MSNHGKLTFRQQMVGFPIWQITVLSILRFLEPLAFTSFFPYVYFMLRDFGISEDDTWRYSSYYAASFAFFQFLFAIQCSKAADKFGRKPVILITLTGLGFSLLLFGFAKNYFIGLMARSFMGALAVIPVIRTMVGEIAVERRHQIAFTVIPLLWNLGSVAGPLVSTIFTKPLKATDIVGASVIESTVASSSFIFNYLDRFMDKYPYALSNIVIALYTWFAVITGFLFLSETHPNLKNRKDYGIQIGDWIIKRLGGSTPVRAWQKDSWEQSQLKSTVNTNTSNIKTSTNNTSSSNNDDNSESQSVFSDVDSITESTPLTEANLNPQSIYGTESPQSLNESDDDDNNLDTISEASFETNGFLTKRTSNAIIRRFSTATQNNLTQTQSRLTETQSILTLKENIYSGAFTKPVIQTITANFIASFHSIVFFEFIPVFLAGQLVVDKIKFPFVIQGGFGFDSSVIGHLLSSTGFVGVISVVVLFPIMDRHLKPNISFRYALAIYPFVYVILPFLIFTLPEYDSRFKPGVTKILLYTISSASTLAGAIVFPQAFIMLHRASPAKHRSYVNGASLSVTSLARCIAPLCWGSVMSLADRHAVSEVSWFLLAFLALIGFVQSFFIDDYNEDLKDEEEEVIPTHNHNHNSERV